MSSDVGCWHNLAAVSGIRERQQREVDAAVSDARVCLRQYLGAAGDLALALGCRGLARLVSLLLLGGGRREVGGPGGKVNSTAQVREGGRGGGVPWRRRRRRPCSPWMMPPPRLPASARVSVAERRRGAHVRERECVGGLCALALSGLLILIRPAFLTPYQFSFSIVFMGLRRRHHSPILAMLAP